MRILIFLLFTAPLLSCSGQEENSESETNVVDELKIEDSLTVDPSIIDTVALGLSFETTSSYNSTKAAIRRKKQTKSSKEDFENYLLNEIVPHWYGTPWDFNGYTAVPNQGVIACGYFVSTTLLHVGVNLNRYHLAQQAGSYEAKSLAIVDSNYFTIYGIDNLFKELENRIDGLYFVGLDNHVGFLYLKDGIPYFLHSNYIENRVMIEKAAYSDAFQSSIYVIAELSMNEELLNKWRTGEEVHIYRH